MHITRSTLLIGTNSKQHRGVVTGSYRVIDRKWAWPQFFKALQRLSTVERPCRDRKSLSNVRKVNSMHFALRHLTDQLKVSNFFECSSS